MNTPCPGCIHHHPWRSELCGPFYHQFAEVSIRAHRQEEHHPVATSQKHFLAAHFTSHPCSGGPGRVFPADQPSGNDCEECCFCVPRYWTFISPPPRACHPWCSLGLSFGAPRHCCASGVSTGNMGSRYKHHDHRTDHIETKMKKREEDLELWYVASK